MYAQNDMMIKISPIKSVAKTRLYLPLFRPGYFIGLWATEPLCHYYSYPSFSLGRDVFSWGKCRGKSIYSQDSRAGNCFYLLREVHTAKVIWTYWLILSPKKSAMKRDVASKITAANWGCVFWLLHVLQSGTTFFPLFYTGRRVWLPPPSMAFVCLSVC